MLRTDDAAAVVEFALILPVMLFIYIGAMEASMLIIMDRKVQSVAGALGDLVARADQKLPSTLMQDYFTAANGIMTAFPTKDMKQTITAVNVDSDGATLVAWSREYSGGGYKDGEFVPGEMIVGTRYPAGRPYPLPNETIEISKGQMVIAAEANYPAYTPFFGIVFKHPVNLYRSSFLLPRFGGTITLN
ncbi:MAG: hypothetical protein ABS75_00650 [Pelagibacterium sp. SCN 63-23]|nr:MAG: hypothetical protein ABS75_00650 [Pelagibacterium sp. SCN 63-23]